MTYTLQDAIDRSISHNERVHCTFEGDHSDLMVALDAIYYDGEIDSATENTGEIDVWGWQDGMANGEMEWRLCVTLRPQIVIDGCSVGYGVGHNWQPATEDNCPASIQEEIAGEIIDGGQSECDDFVASNGQHYRWTSVGRDCHPGQPHSGSRASPGSPLLGAPGKPKG